MQLPKSFTTVTRLSKTVAMCLFILLPFIGFYFGKEYGKAIILEKCQITKSVQSSIPVSAPDINTPGTIATLSGIIKKIPRKTPDIAEDYEVLLDEPLMGISTGRGDGQCLNDVIVNAASSINLERYVDSHITFTASLEWGYAESRYLFISAIQGKELPLIQKRNKNYERSTLWQTFKDDRGYTISYPNDWRVSVYEGKISTIISYDPEKFERSMPFALPKWDVDFSLATFSDIYSLLTNKAFIQADVKMIEKSSTKDGLEIYFVQGKVPLNENAGGSLSIDAIVIDNKHYFIWRGFYSNETIETLKRIVESMEKVE
ncbi:MAG: hypothetical protein WC489_01265 [Patescibacteria group bacterium]